jgi:death-on-curing protein
MSMHTADTVRYVTVSELIYINGTIVGSAAIASGKRQVRDIALLDAAAARPAASAFGADAYPTLAEKAAVLLHGVARNHPFADGNKRTATVGALFMLHINGGGVSWDQAEALTMILNAAEGRCSMAELAAWLPLIERTGAFPLPPDADADMAHIAAIIAAQKWLLDALETR